jgi:hypothetical protein
LCIPSYWLIILSMPINTNYITDLLFKLTNMLIISLLQKKIVLKHVVFNIVGWQFNGASDGFTILDKKVTWRSWWFSHIHGVVGFFCFFSSYLWRFYNVKGCFVRNYLWFWNLAQYIWCLRKYLSMLSSTNNTFDLLFRLTSLLTIFLLQKKNSF